ncbi:disulfide bond formation protein B [Pelagibacteraceae bacterium]|nr:disulfide bond formation protein B [Pelagibacteraceae bacterium]
MIFKHWNILIFIVSLISIITALIAEFVFNLQPCELCLKQRHPYYFMILISAFIFFIPFSLKIFGYFLIQISSIYGLFYSIWHVGVENNLLSGPSGCSAGLSIAENIDNLKEQILSKQVINCEEVIWSFFGISAASINTLVLLFIFLINAIYIYKNYGQKKEKKSN